MKEDRTVVRVVTVSWMDCKGLQTKRSLNVLKRKSFGVDILKEDCSNVGADDTARNILNLHEVEDRIYEVVPTNISTCIETGYVDGYNLRLIPFTQGDRDCGPVPVPENNS